MFTFGKEQLNEGGNIQIFNKGEAGRVLNVSIDINKKGVDYQDEGKNKPDYQVVYTDSTGASTNEGFYYLNEKTHNAKYGTFEKAVQKQWNNFAAIVTVAGGDPTISNMGHIEMLDTMAKMVKGAVQGVSFNVFTNYGTKQNPKRYLQVRSWAPFVESVDTLEEATKLKASPLDQMDRITMDSPSDANVGGAPTGWV